MKKIIAIILIAFLSYWMVGCGGQTAKTPLPSSNSYTGNTQNGAAFNETANKTEKSSEKAVGGDMSMEHGTRVILTIQGAEIPATLNNTLTAQEFIKKLPFSVTVSKGDFDFCGMAGDLAYKESERQAGWKNGDIGYSRGWFALFYSGAEQSQSYTSEMIIGHIDGAYLETIRQIKGNVQITIVRAQ